jgi:hypothetical protein
MLVIPIVLEIRTEICQEQANTFIYLCRCDRILSYGKGTRLLSYKRAELTFSDHRPVTAVYMADVEVFVHRKFQRALTFTNTEVDDHLLLGKETVVEPLNHETGNFPAQVPSKVMAMRYRISESA